MWLLLKGEVPFGGRSLAVIYEEITTKQLDFNEDCWDQVSEEAKSLVKSLLQKDMNDRPTPRQAMEHAWFSSKAALRSSAQFISSNFTIGLLVFLLSKISC